MFLGAKEYRSSDITVDSETYSDAPGLIKRVSWWIFEMVDPPFLKSGAKLRRTFGVLQIKSKKNVKKVHFFDFRLKYGSSETVARPFEDCTKNHIMKNAKKSACASDAFVNGVSGNVYAIVCKVVIVGINM